MFTEELENWLRSNQSQAYAKYIEENQILISKELTKLGVPLKSELAYLYLNYGSFPVRCWYELNEIDSVQEWTDYAHSELGVPDEYLALTSIEGQGITLFNRLSGAVYGKRKINPTLLVCQRTR